VLSNNVNKSSTGVETGVATFRQHHNHHHNHYLTHLGLSALSFKEFGQEKAAIVTQVTPETTTHAAQNSPPARGRKPMLRLTTQEGQRLTAMTLAMRPDWTPNNPGAMLAAINETTGLPAADFGHAMRAMAHYATTTGPDGRPLKRTPNLFHLDGAHWTATAPDEWARPQPPECPDHIGQDAPTCNSCWADVKVGQRPASMIGKALAGSIYVQLKATTP
jgi:hypothetical protein